MPFLFIIPRLHLYTKINKRMAHELLLDEAKADELSQYLHGTVAGQAAQAGKAIEREGFGSLGKETQQGLLTLGKGEHGTTVSTLFAP